MYDDDVWENTHLHFFRGPHPQFLLSLHRHQQLALLRIQELDGFLQLVVSYAVLFRHPPKRTASATSMPRLVSITAKLPYLHSSRAFSANCTEVGVVRQVHTLFVRSAQQVVHELQVREEVEGVRQEVREVKGESKVEESRSLHEHMWMTWMTNTRLVT